jgi:lathosterol oxidase
MFNTTEITAANFLIVPLLVFGRYFITCGIVFSLCYLWKRPAWLFRKIQARFPTTADVRREIGYSALTSLIFAATALLWLKTPLLRSWTKFYTDVDQYGWGYLLVSIPLLLLVHDAYFYWMHRLMHHPRLYRRVHLVHHKSVNPSPWAAYAFHPVEALLEAGIIPLLLVTIPMHPISFSAISTLMLWFNVYGHLGYEFFPAYIYTHPLGRWLNSSVHHNLHHEKFTGNYGLYFSIWDRLCGTLRMDSLEKVAEVHRQIAEKTGDASLNNELPLINSSGGR